MTNSMRFQQVLRLMSILEQTRQMYLKLCTLGGRGNREPFVLAVSTPRMPYVVHNRKPRKTTCRFAVCEEHWVFAVNRSFVATDDVVDVRHHVGGVTSWCCEELGSSIVDNVLRVSFFSLFPFKKLFRSSKPCVVVFLSLLCVVFFHKFVQVIFPYLGCFSCFSLRSRRYDKSRIPLSSFSAPSVSALGGDPEGLSPFQFVTCFDPICDVVFQHFFISFSRASFYVSNPVF